MPQIPAKVNTNKLAFWESLIDVGDKPSRYLKYGEKVIISDPTPIYANKMGDKAYCKVIHHTYGMGYMLKDGLEEITNGAQQSNT